MNLLRKNNMKKISEMKIRNIHIKKETYLIIYKLLHDLLALLLVTFAGIIVADGLLAGLITSKISFDKIAILLLLTVIAITILGKKLDITYKKMQTNKSKLLPALILFSFLLIGNSLLKFSFLENIIITLTTLFIFFLFYEMLFPAKK